MVYWAHSDPAGLAPDDPEARWQRLSEHLENVGAIAGRLADAARPGDQLFSALSTAEDPSRKNPSVCGNAYW
jgi:hypothetical protein